MTAPARVAVAGGGLAGITAAVALAEAGYRVTLLEARPRLGGATASFSRRGLIVDTGQHVFLRCCTAYRGLLARLGMTGAAVLQDRFDVTVLTPDGRARLRRSGLPGPLHLAGALARYPLLPPAQRLAAGRAALAMRLLDPADPALDGQRLGDWLAAHGQGEQARRALWDLFTVSALNIAGDDANLALAATVVKTGLLGARDAADIGVPAVPLGDLHGRAGASLLSRLGARVMLAAKVTAVRRMADGRYLIRLGRGRAGPERAASDASGGDGHDPDRARLNRAGADGASLDGASGPDGASLDWISQDGQSLVVDGVVIAVPPHQAAALVPPECSPAGPGPAQWARLGYSPIVNVHVIYDRRVTRLPFAAAIGSPVQWVFDRTRPSGLAAGQYLAVSLSAASDYVDVPAARLREQFVPALAELFPAARHARVTDFFVTRERRATIRQDSGCGALRPGPATGLAGLVIAGAWTDTGWPDTMEGAVRSGLNAAMQLRRELAGLTAGAPAAPAAGAAA
jgi:predicted NAD/FAD-binding protein